MSKNINCAAMGYDCVFSITADDDEQDLMLEVTEKHALNKHPELIENGELKPEVRKKLRDLLSQSHFAEQTIEV